MITVWLKVVESQAVFLKKVKKSFFKIGTEFEQQFRKCLITKDLRVAGGPRPRKSLTISDLRNWLMALVDNLVAEPDHPILTRAGELVSRIKTFARLRKVADLFKHFA
jgi:hypothetical protein